MTAHIKDLKSPTEGNFLDSNNAEHYASPLEHRRFSEKSIKVISSKQYKNVQQIILEIEENCNSKRLSS
jgi:hypothetical protein